MHAPYYFPPLPPWEEENEPQDGMLDWSCKETGYI
jgi:hypothetical protein